MTATSGTIHGAIATTSTFGTIGESFVTSLGITADQLMSDYLMPFLPKAITEINSELSAGIVIPTIMGVDFSDVELNWESHWVEAGINLTPAQSQFFADFATAFFADEDTVKQIFEDFLPISTEEYFL